MNELIIIGHSGGDLARQLARLCQESHTSSILVINDCPKPPEITKEMLEIIKPKAISQSKPNQPFYMGLRKYQKRK